MDHSPIHSLQRYSQSHRTVCVPPAGTIFRDHSPIHGQWTLFHSAGIVPGKSRELPGTRQDSFVNRVVKGFFPFHRNCTSQR